MQKMLQPYGLPPEREEDFWGKKEKKIKNQITNGSSRFISLLIFMSWRCFIRKKQNMICWVYYIWKSQISIFILMILIYINLY